jgi:hypothetical protein
VPVGGIFTGVDGVKTREQARAFGGRAGTAYDSCYQLPCDMLANVVAVLHQMADAAAVAALELANDPPEPRE